MLLIYHDGNKVAGIHNIDSSAIAYNNTLTISENLVALAQEFPEEVLVWCHIQLKELLNVSEIERLFHHRKLLFSYNPSGAHYLGRSIGYVEESPFIKINAAVTYATWQTSSWVGGIHSEVLLALKNKIPLDTDFDYFLTSLAKLGMPKGLICYSEPKLLLQNVSLSSLASNKFQLFRFVKQHYRTRWVFLLLFNLLVYERKFPFLAFLFSLLYKNRNKLNINLEYIKVQSSRKVCNKKTVDVIIPTIGRSDYLYDVLRDLKAQTHLLSNVIIVEQNSNKGSESELDYLLTEDWPFKIKHTFTHQTGACHARNIALEQISSEWVFFADDDIRINADFIQNAFLNIGNFGAKAVTLRCYQKGESQTTKSVFQWGTFGAGCSIVFADSLQGCKFNKGYEFGFGEDGDFGMQLRHQGGDILYFPEPSILHLKAPVGGFRSTPTLQWQNDVIQPKPSPTIMLYQILQNTQEQIRGYKTILFMKYYSHQKIKNPIRYYIHFQKQWERSVFWASQLKKSMLNTEELV